MCRQRGAIAWLVSLAWIVLCAGGAFGVVLPFDDGFENIGVGYYPSDNGWQTGFSGVTAYVSNHAAHSGTRSFRLQSYPFWSRCDYIHLDAVPDRLAYEASLYTDPIPGRGAWVGLAGAVGGQMPCYNHFIVRSEDGSMGTVDFSGAMGLPPVAVGEFAIGEWVTVRAELDFAVQTSDLWLNGELAASGVPIQPKEFDDPTWGYVVLDRFGAAEYNWIGGGVGVIYLDDVSVHELAGQVMVDAIVDLKPDTLQAASRGRWLTCYIELPEGYPVTAIDLGTLLLESALGPAPPVLIGDYDGDAVPDLMMKFDRRALLAMLAPGEQTVWVTGQLLDGTPIAGSDVVRVKSGGRRR